MLIVSVVYLITSEYTYHTEVLSQLMMLLTFSIKLRFPKLLCLKKIQFEKQDQLLTYQKKIINFFTYTPQDHRHCRKGSPTSVKKKSTRGPVTNAISLSLS